jgi:hypothetical protein
MKKKEMTLEEKETLLMKALKTPEGLRKLGQAMAAPISRSLSMSSVMRGVVQAIPLIVLTPEEMEEERIANKPW